MRVFGRVRDRHVHRVSLLGVRAITMPHHPLPVYCEVQKGAPELPSRMG